MIKYIINLENSKIEFASEEAALQYKSEHAIGADIVVVDDTLAVTVKPVQYKDLTPRQMRQILILNGIQLSSVDALLDALPEPQKSLAKVEWEYSVAVKKDNPLINQMAAGLGLTAEQVNAMWKAAENL